MSNNSEYYEVYGESSQGGAPIVFIHGSFANTATWKKIIAELSKAHQCIAIKLPGHCGTPDPVDMEAPTLETEFSIIENAIKEQTSGPVHLVGHSYGGVVALELALKGSVALTHLTLFEPVTVGILAPTGETEADQQVKSFVGGYRAAVAQEEPYACGHIIDFWGGAGSFKSMPQALQDGMAPLTRNNIRHWDLCQTFHYPMSAVKSFAVPTTVVTGSASNPIAQTIAKQLHQHLPNSALHTIDEASHFMVTTHAKACLALMSLR